VLAVAEGNEDVVIEATLVVELTAMLKAIDVVLVDSVDIAEGVIASSGTLFKNCYQRNT
jgi:hypothetical protein